MAALLATKDCIPCPREYDVDLNSASVIVLHDVCVLCEVGCLLPLLIVVLSLFCLPLCLE